MTAETVIVAAFLSEFPAAAGSGFPFFYQRITARSIKFCSFPPVPLARNTKVKDPACPSEYDECRAHAPGQT